MARPEVLELPAVLEPGERVVWSDRPQAPRTLRRLGFPPRSTGAILLQGLLLSGLLGLLGLGCGLRDAGLFLRGSLVAAGVLPLLGLAGTLAWVFRRRARTRYAITDRRRGLLWRDGRAWHLELPDQVAIRADPDGGAGDLDLGACRLQSLDGGEAHETPVRFADVAYPASVQRLVAGLPFPSAKGVSPEQAS